MNRSLPPCDHDQCPPSHCNLSEHASAGSALLGLLADIRAAVGDPTGKLMQDELVERCRALAGFAASGWRPVCQKSMPAFGQIVWLFDGKRVWLGGCEDDGEGWLWGNTYGQIWHNGMNWDGDLETDDDYKPTHWMPLPEPPNRKGQP